MQVFVDVAARAAAAAVFQKLLAALLDVLTIIDMPSSFHLL